MVVEMKPSVVDFVEEIHVNRSKNESGEFNPWLEYDYCWTKEDTAVGKIETIDFDQCVPLDAILRILENALIEGEEIKKALVQLMENDKIYLRDEY